MIPGSYPRVSVRRKLQIAPWFIIAVVVLSGLGMLPGQDEEGAKPHRGEGAARQPGPAAAARADMGCRGRSWPASARSSPTTAARSSPACAPG